MAKARGKSVALSPFRRLIVDLMHFSQKVPAVAIDRRMHLGELTAAREASARKIPWTVIFAKAFALVARRRPELRQSYLPFPWPHLYEHPYSTVALNVNRTIPSGELVVVQCLIKRPDNRSLAELEDIIRQYQAEPLESLRWYRRSVTMSRLPRPLRRLVWTVSLSLLGRQRCHNFGTFGLSSVAAQGAGVLHLIPVLTSMLHYGLFDASGSLDVRLTWDHRVMDGVLAARILVEIEDALRSEILTELRGMQAAAAA